MLVMLIVEEGNADLIAATVVARLRETIFLFLHSWTWCRGRCEWLVCISHTLTLSLPTLDLPGSNARVPSHEAMEPSVAIAIMWVLFDPTTPWPSTVVAASRWE